MPLKCLLVFILICTVHSALAKKRFGLGVMVGNPTGFSAKYRMTKKKAIDAALSWSLGDASSFHLHSNYLHHHFSIFRVDDHPVHLYYGVGGRIKTREKKGDDETAFGPRFPLGLNTFYKKPRIEVFIEVSLTVDLIPSTEEDFDFGLGARYYF